MKEGLDKGWAWIVLISTLLSYINLACLAYNVGVLNVAFLEYFDYNVATTSVIGSVFLSFIFFMGPVASFIINRFSCRVAHNVGGCLAFVAFSSGFFINKLELFILTYSIVGGAGLSLCYTVVNVILSFNFKKYLGLSIGLTVAGGGLGILISGPITQYFLDTYGLHGTFLLMGSIAFNQVVFGSLMFPTNTENYNKSEQIRLRNEAKDNGKFCCYQIFQFEIFKNKSFVIILICDFLWSIPYGILVFHIPNDAVLQGSTPNEAAWLITVLGIGSTISRLLTGLSVGPNGFDPLLLFLGFNGILGGLLLAFPLYSYTHTGRIIFSILVGIYTGGLNALRNPVCMTTAGLQYISSAIGLHFFLEGIAFLIGSPIAGLIVDQTGSYEYAFFLSGAIFIATFLLSMTASIWRKVPEPDVEPQFDDTAFTIS